MNYLTKFIFIICAVIFFQYSASAEISVSLKLNRYESAVTDSVKLVVGISGSRDADEPQVRGLEYFTVQKTGRSSQIQIINGRMASNLDYNYIIQPKGIGIFDIGPAFVKIDGKMYQSGTVRLTVKNYVDQKGGVNAPLFLTAALSSARAYLEEEVQYTLRLYYKNDISNITPVIPEADGLSFKQIGKAVEYSTTYNSKNYQVIELKFSVAAARAGRFNINPARMTMLVRIPQRRQDDDELFSMDDFFSNIRGKQVTLASNPLVLDVLGVPEAGKPADYTGLIGTYSITSELTPGRIKAGESATLTVTVKGSGNVNRIPDLKMPDIKNAKIYSDEPKLDIQQSEKGIAGIKTMKWAIVPEKQGQYIVPSLTIAYFDSLQRYYSRISTRQFFLLADPGSAEQQQSPFAKERTRSAGKEEVEELGTDILPVHRSARSLAKQQEGSGWFLWLLLLAPAMAFGAAATIYRLTNKGMEISRIKVFRAANNFYKTCRDKDLSANALSNALKDYFNNRFKLEMGSLTPQESSAILKQKGCKEETINQMEWILKKIEILIYTGKGDDPCDLSEETVIIVKSIEKEI
ncbi:MAG: BatD family protein [Spirochaetota bacterium]